MWLALGIFALTYAAMAGARLPFMPVDRPAAALCGAVAMVLAGIITIDEAFAAIDLGVLTLLVGVMILAAYLQQAHFFRYAAWWVLTRARSPVRLLWGLVFVSGGLSALLLNDTICLMFTPLVVAVIADADLPPLPFLLGLASATNIGGVVTFTGNPQNMIIGQAAAGDPSYLEYLALALPIGVLSLVVNAALITWMFRRELKAAAVGPRSIPKPYVDRRLAAKAIAAIVLFVVAAAAGVSLPGAAIAAAAALIVAARIPPRPTFATIDFSLLLFFVGLFVVVRGFTSSGAIEWAMEPLLATLGAGGAKGDAAFVGLTALGSNVVSNVPYVMVAVEWVPQLADPPRAFALLAIASTLAGNLTLFGSVANIIVFELAGPRGEIGFFRFLRYGVVLTTASFMVAGVVLVVATTLGY